ncbi:chemotaxis protein CheW [Thermodesulforhabdus norvegica]|uniref:Chemotaxis signal transduction protein n=1 Tax=Thermodesulforhabdus norvegica TaxID=39841 RepID=A0A1I4SDE1_9BACT|nr:chemotaxis protein CheW [Thermodesulforhabdus norvegica]SFM62475.1 Chemotaxis signal transduction protein [Thermodesulforhabdus norvegica]
MNEKIRILLVEDSAITRKMETKVLKELGFDNVIEAEDGQQAVEILQKDPTISLIISDWNMPNMGGIELLRWVRSREQFKDLPFILATGRAQKKEAAEAAEAGASNIITKPFAPVELKKVIQDTLAGLTLQAKSREELKRRVPQRDDSGRVVLSIAHIQITDHLTLGVAKNFIETGKVTPKNFTLQTRCMTSWNPVQEALERAEVDGAFILAPIAMDLFAFGVPLKMISLAHKNGSICVRKKTSVTDLGSFFRGKTFVIPHELSIHHMLSHMFITAMGLKPGIAGVREGDFYYEVVPPIRMPDFLKTNPMASGFMVAEPIGTKAIAEGIAEQLFLSAELWQNHPCCIVVMREEVIEEHGEAVEEFVKLLVQAGEFISKKPETAAEIGVAFLDPNRNLGLRVPILKNVLTEPQGIKTDDLMPDHQSLTTMQRYMHDNMGIGTPVDLNAFVMEEFIERACREHTGYVPRYPQLLDPLSLIEKINRSIREGRESSKSKLGHEGKYLIFLMNGQYYGVDVMNVKEIVGIMPIRSLIQAPDYVKGIINLRGAIIPVVDLRRKLGLPETEYTERTCIIILEVPHEGKILKVGVIVDTVSHVESIKAQDIEETPGIGLYGNTGYLSAVAKTGESLKLLLSVSDLFGEGEIETLSRAA